MGVWSGILPLLGIAIRGKDQAAAQLAIEDRNDTGTGSLARHPAAEESPAVIARGSPVWHLSARTSTEYPIKPGTSSGRRSGAVALPLHEA